MLKLFPTCADLERSERESRSSLPAVAFAPAIPLLLWVVPCTALCWWRARTFEAEAGYAAWGAPVWLWAVTGLLLGPFALLAMYLATTPPRPGTARRPTREHGSVTSPPTGPTTASQQYRPDLAQSSCCPGR